MSDTGLGPHHPKTKTTIVISRAALTWLRKQALEAADVTGGGRLSHSEILERLIRKAATSNDS